MAWPTRSAAPTGATLKLMILIGKRKTALANMLWEEIDKDWFWDPPPSEVRNKRLHGVPLPKLAQRVLHPRQDKGKVFGDINLDKLERKIKKDSGMEDFFWHGLRHLAETKTAELRDERDQPLIPPHVRDMLFDHSVSAAPAKATTTTTTSRRCGPRCRCGLITLNSWCKPRARRYCADRSDEELERDWHAAQHTNCHHGLRHRNHRCHVRTASGGELCADQGRRPASAVPRT